ncbi:fimbrial protein, partial [Salmonella enterica subsp. enterica serovar Typhimurium]
MLPVSVSDNLHFSGSLLATPCTLTMQGTWIPAFAFSSLDSSAVTPDGQSARTPLVFELTDFDSALSNGVQVTFTGTEATGMRGILAIYSYSG